LGRRLGLLQNVSGAGVRPGSASGRGEDCAAALRRVAVLAWLRVIAGVQPGPGRVSGPAFCLLRVMPG